jgi:hypothetical protein
VKVTKDPEVVGRIENRIKEIEEEVAVDPPAITVDFKDASASEVLATLAKATGRDLVLWQENDAGKGHRFSLNIREANFWDIFLAVNKQHDMPMFDHPMKAGSFIVWNLGSNGWKNAVKTERPSVIVIPEEIERRDTLVLQAGEGVKRRLVLRYRIAVDPRVTVIGDNSCIFDVLDENDKVIHREEARAARFFWTGEPANIRKCTAEFLLPEGTGKRLKRVRGITNYCIQLGSDKKEIKDIEQWGEKVFEVAGKRVWIGRFRVGGGEVRFDVHGSTIADPSPDSRGLHVQVFDANEQKLADVWTGPSTWNFLEGCPFETKGPYRMTVEGPGKVLDRTVHYEFRDLPIP